MNDKHDGGVKALAQSIIERDSTLSNAEKKINQKSDSYILAKALLEETEILEDSLNHFKQWYEYEFKSSLSKLSAAASKLSDI